jgi:hypothetical protein
MSKVRVKFNTNVWDNAQTIEGGKNANTFFTEGMVADVYETSLILECLGKKTAERVDNNTPLVQDPGKATETVVNVEVETPQEPQETEETDPKKTKK